MPTQYDDDEQRAAIHKRIMQIIAEQKATQSDVARATGSAAPSVSDVFHGAVFNPVRIARFAKFYRVNCHWLLTGDGPRSLPGQGNGDVDKAFGFGAQAVLSELKRVILDLDTMYGKLPKTTSPAQAALRARAIVRSAEKQRPKKKKAQ